MTFKPEKFLSCTFIIVIALFLCSVSYQLASRGVDKITGNDEGQTLVKIDWAKLYPFESESD